jgi:hypothetical protein
MINWHPLNPARPFLWAILPAFVVLLLLPLSAGTALPAPVQTGQAVHAWTTLFQDDFEDGDANDWQLNTGWEVELEGSNHVLSGAGYTSAILTTGHDWADYRFKTRIKLVDNQAHYGETQLSYRRSDIGRYVVCFWIGGLVLGKERLGIEFEKTKGKIYKTEDGGENWRCVWEGDNLARFVLFDPTNPNVLYASTGIFDREAYNDVGVGVLKSTDGGETWFPINNGIPDSEGNRFVGFLEMHPTNPQVLFAASGMGPRPGAFSEPPTVERIGNKRYLARSFPW